MSFRLMYQMGEIGIVPFYCGFDNSILRKDDFCACIQMYLQVVEGLFVDLKDRTSVHQNS